MIPTTGWLASKKKEWIDVHHWKFLLWWIWKFGLAADALSLHLLRHSKMNGDCRLAGFLSTGTVWPFDNFEDCSTVTLLWWNRLKQLFLLLLSFSPVIPWHSHSKSSSWCLLLGRRAHEDGKHCLFKTALSIWIEVYIYIYITAPRKTETTTRSSFVRSNSKLNHNYSQSLTLSHHHGSQKSGIKGVIGKLLTIYFHSILTLLKGLTYILMCWSGICLCCFIISNCCYVSC